MPYEEFCRSRPELFPLIFTVKEADSKIKAIKAQPLTEVKPGDLVYIDLRFFGGATWYNSIGLPDSEKLNYVFKASYTTWTGRNHRSIWLQVELSHERYALDHYQVRAYGSQARFNPDSITLVTSQLILQHPMILPVQGRDNLLRQLRQL